MRPAIAFHDKVDGGKMTKYTLLITLSLVLIASAVKADDWTYQSKPDIAYLNDANTGGQNKYTDDNNRNIENTMCTSTQLSFNSAVNHERRLYMEWNLAPCSDNDADIEEVVLVNQFSLAQTDIVVELMHEGQWVEICDSRQQNCVQSFNIRNYIDTIDELKNIQVRYRFTERGGELCHLYLSCVKLRAIVNCPTCGNGKVDFGEVCDDGNTNNYDECTNECTRPLHKFPIKTCLGEGDLLVYQGDQFQEPDTVFRVGQDQDQLIVFTKAVPDLDVYQGGNLLTPTDVADVTRHFRVIVYTYSVTPGSEIRIDARGSVTARNIQGYILQDAASSVYDMSTLEDLVVYDEEVNNRVYLTPGVYDWVFFDKYRLYEQNQDDRRLLRSVKRNVGNSQQSVLETRVPVVPVEAPYALAEGVVVDRLNVEASAYYDLTLDTEDSIYSMIVNCPEPRCGDGNLDSGEECDDGNNEEGDGCSADCKKPTCFQVCRPSYGCDGGYTCSDGLCREMDCPSEPDCVCQICGDGRVDSGEECDDGNTVDGDGCNSDCSWELCEDKPEKEVTVKPAEVFLNDQSTGGVDKFTDDNGVHIRDALCTNTRLSFEASGRVQHILYAEWDLSAWIEPGDTDYDIAEVVLENQFSLSDVDLIIEVYADGGYYQVCDSRQQNCVGSIDLSQYIDTLAELEEIEVRYHFAQRGNIQPLCHLNMNCIKLRAKIMCLDCGDDVVNQEWETCDDTDQDGIDYGTTDCWEHGNACRLPGTEGQCTCCGDGVVQAGEQCEPGQVHPVTGRVCSIQCIWPQPVCGDDVLDAGESCDDTNQDGIAYGNTACWDNGNACRLPGTEGQCTCCGDGVVQAGEDCDDGNSDNDDSCTNDCRAPVCGDYEADWPNGAGQFEYCDFDDYISYYESGGQADATACRVYGNDCRADCTCCGDGVLSHDEQCDVDFYGRVAEGSLCTADLCGTDCQCQAACDCLDTDGGITPDQFYIFGWAEYCNDDRTRLTDYCVGTESTCDTCETPCNVVEDCALYDGHPDYENFAGTDTCNACNVERNQCDTCPATCETEADCVDPDGDGTAELDGCHCIDSVCRSCPFYSFVYCPKVGDGLYYDVLSFDWEDCETDQDTMKCCNEKSDCVDETGYCRRVGSTVDTDSDLEFEVCYAGAGMPGGWVDADKSPLLCDQLDEHILGKNKGWLDCTPGDECVEGVNDYLSDDGMKFTYGLCCGDDASENLVESRIYDAIGQVGSTLYQGCCENAGACVDSQGSCHEEGSGGICFQEGVQMVCHAGNWVLEPNADCPGCSECDITGEGGVKDGQITLADMNLLGTIIEEALSTGDYDEAYDMDLDGDNDWDDWNYCNSMFGDSCSTCPDGFVQPNEECESVNTSKCEDYICADGRKKVLAGCSDLTCSCVYEDTGSCDADCGASCESNADCPADSCEETFDDFCQGSMLVDYDNNNRLDQDSITITNYADNICTQGCACTDNTAACAPPAIAPRCVSGVCGASCSSDADCGAGFDQQRCLEENKGSGSLSDVVVAVEGQAGFAAIGDSWCCGEQGEYYVRNYGSLTLRTPSLPGQGPYAFSFAFRLPDAAQPIEYLEIVCGSGPSERTYEISGTELESIAASQDNPNGFTWYTPLECSFSQGHNEVHVYSESMTTVHLTAMRIQGSGGTCNGCQCSFD